jgi:hypothetical protein
MAALSGLKREKSSVYRIASTVISAGVKDVDKRLARLRYFLLLSPCLSVRIT